MKAKMNIELLKQLRTRFLRMRHPEHFQMDVQTECGSVMCIAGHALDLAGYKRKLRPARGRSCVLDFDFIAPSGRVVKSPLGVAARELGLNYRREGGNKAYELFHDMSLTTPKDAAERIQELIDSAGSYR